MFIYKCLSGVKLALNPIDVNLSALCSQASKSESPKICQLTDAFSSFRTCQPIPGHPELAGLVGVGDQLQQGGRGARLAEQVEVIGRADRHMPHAPQRRKARQIGGVGVGQPLAGPRAQGLQPRQAPEDLAAAIVNDGQDAAVAFDLATIAQTPAKRFGFNALAAELATRRMALFILHGDGSASALRKG